MSLKSRFHSWLCVWLSFVLSAMVASSPIMLSVMDEDVRVEESDPTDSSEEVEVDEVMLSESNRGQRRQRREQGRVRATRFSNHRLCGGQSTVDGTGWLLAGQGSLRGRCGPLHC